MAERIVALDIRIGTNGSGKSFMLKKYLAIRQRNLVLPANRSDKNWHGYKELVPVKKFRVDTNDPLGKRKLAYWDIPGLNSFTGTRVLHITEPAMFDAVIHKESGFRNGALFVDDTRNRIRTKGGLPNNVVMLFGDRRMKMLDIYLAAWMFQDVNAEIYGFNPRIFVHNVTGAPNTYLREKVTNIDELHAVWQRVRAVNEKLPSDKRWHFEVFHPA